MIGVERWAPATNLPDDSRSTRPHAPDLRRAAARTATPGTDPASRHQRTPIRRAVSHSPARRRIVPPMQTRP